MILGFKRRFSLRLALAFFLTSALAVASTGVLTNKLFRSNLIAELTASLTTTAAVAQAQIDKSLFAKADRRRLHELSHYLAETTGARISFIGADGAVLGDSAVTADGLAAVENHLNRPEVRGALDGRPTGAIRYSDTIDASLLYAAVPATSGGSVAGVVRAAMPLTQVESKLATIRRRTVALSVAVVLIATLVAFVLGTSMSRPVREMSEVARRLAEGDYGARVADLPADEHGRLADSLNVLATQVEEKVRELSAEKIQLAAILGNMNEAVVALDSAGRIVAVNPALRRVFGLEPGAGAGKFFLEALRHHQLAELVRRVLETREPRVEEIRTFVPDERIFEAQAVPIAGDGAFAGALIVLHDITRLRRLEQVRRDFVANVSHELRTPLASIKGFAETLELGALDDPKNALSFVRSIEKQADRMTALVEDLLDLTAIESGKRSPVLEPVSLPELLEDVAAGLRPLAGRRKVEIRMDVPAALARIAGDRNQVRQIFVNLMENAIKFNREGGWVAVAARAAGDHVEVTVADSGAGIPAQDLDRVFERFYRVDKARSREQGGTGLGLAIVKHLVEAHGGAVRVDSSVGRGSEFTVSLPLSKHA